MPFGLPLSDAVRWWSRGRSMPARPLAALIDVMVRGPGMAQRQDARIAPSRTSAQHDIRSVVGAGDRIDRSTRSRGLFGSGAITAAEHETLRTMALN